MVAESTPHEVPAGVGDITETPVGVYEYSAFEIKNTDVVISF